MARCVGVSKQFTGMRIEGRVRKISVAVKTSIEAILWQQIRRASSINGSVSPLTQGNEDGKHSRKQSSLIALRCNCVRFFRYPFLVY